MFLLCTRDSLFLLIFRGQDVWSGAVRGVDSRVLVGLVDSGAELFRAPGDFLCAERGSSEGSLTLDSSHSVLFSICFTHALVCFVLFMVDPPF